MVFEQMQSTYCHCYQRICAREITFFFFHFDRVWYLPTMKSRSKNSVSLYFIEMMLTEAVSVFIKWYNYPAGDSSNIYPSDMSVKVLNWHR